MCSWRRQRPGACPAREEVNAQMDVNFYKNWQAFAAIRRDLIADQTLDSEFGLGYEDECLGISVAYRRKYTTDRDLPPSTSVILRFSLKTTDADDPAFQPVSSGRVLLYPSLNENGIAYSAPPVRVSHRGGASQLGTCLGNAA